MKISKVSLRKALAISIFVFTPFTSLGECLTDIESCDSSSAFYLKGFYNPSWLGKHEFKNAGLGAVAADSAGSTQGSVTGEYKPEYDFNAVGGGLAIGYSYTGMRVELEGLMSTKFEPKDDANKTFYAEVSVPSDLAADENNLTGITKAAGVFKNNGFSFMAAMLNAYYDFVMSDVMMPYFGIGAGIASVTLDSNQEVSTYPFAGQLKAGVNFNLSKISGTSILPYVGYRLLYFMEKEANDDNILSTDSVVRKDGSDYVSTPITDAKFEYKMKTNTLLHNFEIGFMIPLNG